MSRSLSQPFVTSFLETCFEAGLAKEAAAELLQSESVRQELRARPSFAEGYLSLSTRFPGGLRPVLDEEQVLEKYASKGLARAAKGLWDVAAGLGGAAKGVVTGTGKVVNKTLGPNPDSLLKKHPFAVNLASVAGTGLGTYGMMRLMDRDNRLAGSGDHDPFIGTSGASREAYEKSYQDRLKGYETGLFETNQAVDSIGGRINTLTRDINDNRAGGDAYQELQDLQRRKNKLTENKQRHEKQLVDTSAYNEKLIGDIAKRTAELEKDKASWVAAPGRWATQLAGGNLFDGNISQNAINKRIAALRDNSVSAATKKRLADDRLSILRKNITGNTPSPTPLPNKTEEFLPAYD